MSHNSLNVLGLMSGTSMDGIDCSLLQTNGTIFKRLNKNLLFPYRKKTFELLQYIIKNKEFILKKNNVFNILENLVTQDHANAVHACKKKFGLDIELIGFHGQTIFHDPINKLSIQVGNGHQLSMLTNNNVIFNFRENDLLQGGQGSPLSPIYHVALIKKEKIQIPACFINIGGVSNITWWDGSKIIAFDTGPGNGLMDSYLQEYENITYDKNGALAYKGNVNKKIIGDWLKHRYFKGKPPKSLDRNFFINNLNNSDFQKLSLEDKISTLSQFTIETIIRGLQLLPAIPKVTIIAGGGQHNDYIVASIKEALNNTVSTADEIGLPGDFLESELIAFLTARSYYNLPITFPDTTGVKSPQKGGVFCKTNYVK